MFCAVIPITQASRRDLDPSLQAEGDQALRQVLGSSSSDQVAVGGDQDGPDAGGRGPLAQIVD